MKFNCFLKNNLVRSYCLYTYQQKYAIIRENAKIYQKARKKVKTEILNELTNILKFNRDYLAYLLKNTGKKIYLKDKGIVLKGNIQKKDYHKEEGKRFIQMI